MKITNNKMNSNIKKLSGSGKITKISDNQSLKQGDIIKGEIADIKPNKITIKLSNGQVVEAKMTEQFEFNIGQKLDFIVKDSSPEQLLLKPLIDEGSMSENKLIQILQNANLTINEENLNGVLKLLENQMPVDRESLIKFISYTKQFKDTDVHKILFMMKNNINVSKENIDQLELMEKGENKIIKNIATFNDDISSIVKNGDASKIVKLLLSNNESSSEIFNQVQKLLDSNQTQIKGDSTISEIPLNNILNENEINIIESEIIKSLNSENVKNNKINVETVEVNTGEEKNIEDLTSKQSMQVNDNNEANNSNKVNNNSELNNNIMSKLKGMVIQDKNIGDLFEIIKELDIPVHKKESISVLLSEKITYSLISKEIIMNREHLSNPKELNDFYNKLYNKVLDVLKLDVTSSEGKVNDIMKEASNLKNSIEFMSDLNNNFNFVQIPIMLKDKMLYSELYIFNNKRQLKNKKGAVSALLRLDLLKLGHLDIHVSKKEKDVDIKFYTEDENKTKVLKDSIFKLHNVLKNKGFNVVGMVAMESKKDFNVVEDFFKENKESQQKIKRYTFDMRA